MVTGDLLAVRPKGGEVVRLVPMLPTSPVELYGYVTVRHKDVPLTFRNHADFEQWRTANKLPLRQPHSGQSFDVDFR